MAENDKVSLFGKLSPILIPVSRFLIYVIFIFSIGIYVYDRQLYSDVEKWNYVVAEDFKIEDEGYTTFTDSEAGRNAFRSGASAARYSYTVEGRKYEGSVVSPNGSKELTAEIHNQSESVKNEPTERKIYYKPTNHSVSVLFPNKYTGYPPLIIAICCVAIILFRLFRILKQA